MKSLRQVGRALGIAVLIAATFANTATFVAAEPGADLEPVGGAASVIDLIQGQEAILWSSLSGVVNTYRVVGWPSSDGVHDLGGALVIEAPEEGSAGVINIGERPQSLTFDIDG